MVRGHVACRPTGSVITTIEYSCGQCANLNLKPGSHQGELMRRMHARACKDCSGQQGKLIKAQMPTKVGNPTQVAKTITRELRENGSTARVVLTNAYQAD